MQAIDLSKTLRPYAGKWVAVTKDYEKVIASGKTLKEAKSKAKDKEVRYTYVNLLRRGD
jgi:hypothetical protein